MAKRRRHRSRLVEDLRLTIDCLPVSTRRAMLDGVQSGERIIVGAYVDREGGMCPMLAAHRRGGPTAFLSFARSWDRFARARGGVRQATRRELDILVGQLQSSLMSEADVDLDRAIEEHRRLVGRRRARVVEPLGEIVVRRLPKRRYIESPGRMNMISGTTHAGVTLSR
jgi:hypothetical protein